jgi:predicted nucleic acid-binding protein
VITVYLDTGPLYALADKRDQNHSKALELFTQLAATGAQLICPTSTLLEFHNLMVYKGIREAHTVAATTYRSYAYKRPDDEDIRTALEIIAKYSDQGVTLTDAVLASMAKRN